MIQDEEFYANNLNASIADLFVKLPDLIRSFDCILIAVLDSTCDLRNDPTFKKMSLPYRFLGGKVLVDGGAALELGRTGAFSGFDEIWCYKKNMALQIPEDVRIGGPYEAAKPLRDSVKRWMRQSDCALGLGDGTGLNFITNDVRIAGLIEKKHSGV